jgi:hypothetical protein
MCVRGVVPRRGQGCRWTVEDDPTADENEAVHELLDRSELVRSEEDRHPELAMELFEQSGESLLGVDVDARRGLVEDKEVGARGKCLGDEGALLLASREPRDHGIALLGEADALDRLVDERTVRRTQRPEQTPPWNAAGGDDLAHADRRVDSELGPLREIADPPAAADAGGRLSEEECLSSTGSFEPERDAQKRRLPASVRPGDRNELASVDPERHVMQYLTTSWIGEGDIAEVDGYRHPSAVRS